MSQTSLSHLASVAALAGEREGDGKLEENQVQQWRSQAELGNKRRTRTLKIHPLANAIPEQSMATRVWSRCAFIRVHGSAGSVRVLIEV